MPHGSVSPVSWGKVALTPHRERAPRTQCPACKGGGEINGVYCRDCNGRGWHDASHPPHDRKTATDADAY